MVGVWFSIVCQFSFGMYQILGCFFSMNEVRTWSCYDNWIFCLLGDGNLRWRHSQECLLLFKLFHILLSFSPKEKKKKRRRRERKLGYFIIEWLTTIQLQSIDEAENFALLLFISNYCDHLSLNSTFVGVSKEGIYIFCDDGYKDWSLFSFLYYWEVSQIFN